MLRSVFAAAVSITSGMRNDEAIGIEVGAWRRVVKDGILFCWVSTIEHKTGKGRVEYLVPELTLNTLEILAKYSVTIRKELVYCFRKNQPPTNGKFKSYQ
ncbi:hypothetical protein GCM10009085_54530 [Pseudomonas avellanae]|nr:hypothetical protein GCM10009085_54530 [Pseudomonas avellanae]